MKSDQQLLRVARAELDAEGKNPAVVDKLSAYASEAAATLYLLLHSQNENIALAAARDILDRSGYQPPKAPLVTQNNLTVNNNPAAAPMTEEEFTTLVESYARRTAITVK